MPPIPSGNRRRASTRPPPGRSPQALTAGAEWRRRRLVSRLTAGAEWRRRRLASRLTPGANTDLRCSPGRPRRRGHRCCRGPATTSSHPSSTGRPSRNAYGSGVPNDTPARSRTINTPAPPSSMCFMWLPCITPNSFVNSLGPAGVGELVADLSVGLRVDLTCGEPAVEQLHRLPAAVAGREQPGHRPQHQGDEPAPERDHHQPAGHAHAAAVASEHLRHLRAPAASAAVAVATDYGHHTWRGPPGNGEGSLKVCRDPTCTGIVVRTPSSADGHYGRRVRRSPT